jgi:hypothetical protein
MAGSAVVSALSLSVAAYFTSERQFRNILAAGAAAGFIVPPWTLILMLPVNNELAEQLQAAALKPMEPLEEQRVLDLLDKWRAMHRVRMVLGTIALSASLVGLLATDRLIWCVQYSMLALIKSGANFEARSTKDRQETYCHDGQILSSSFPCRSNKETIDFWSDYERLDRYKDGVRFKRRNQLGVRV